MTIDGEFQAEAGQRHHADDDAGAGAGGRGVERADRAVGQRLHQLLRHQRGVLAQEAQREGDQRGVEHRQRRRIADQHEHHHGDQRDEVEAVAPRHLAERQLRLEGDVPGAELLGVEFDHEQQRQIIETGRDRRHPDHVEIADLEKLGDQERGGAEHRRRQDGAEPAGRQQAAGGVLLEAGLGQHRIGDGADHHGGGDARSGGTAEQERRQHHGAAGAVRLAAHQRQREIDEELAGAGLLQERAVDREQDDQRRRDVDRDAEDALQRDEQMPDQPRQVVAAMGPGRRQMRAEHRIGDEQQRHHRHDRPGGAPRRFQQQHDEHHADDDVPAIGHGGAVGEIVAAPQRIDDGGHRDDAGHHVPPAHPVAEPRRQRKQQEAQHQREGDVGVAQLLRRHDGVGGVEMEQAHHHRDRGRDPAGPAHQPVGGAFLGLDEGFRLEQGLVRNGDHRRRWAPELSSAMLPPKGTLFKPPGLAGRRAWIGPHSVRFREPWQGLSPRLRGDRVGQWNRLTRALWPSTFPPNLKGADRPCFECHRN